MTSVRRESDTTAPKTAGTDARPLPDGVPGAPEARLRGLLHIAGDFTPCCAIFSSRAALRWAGLEDPSDSVLLVGPGGAALVVPTQLDARVHEAVTTIDFGPERPRAEAIRAALAATGIALRTQIVVDGPPLEELAEFARIDISDHLARARMLKDADELALLKESCRLVGDAHIAVREAFRPGVSEAELWTLAELTLSNANIDAETRLMIGSRTAFRDGAPGAAVAVDADVALFKLAATSNGYWADSCATFCCGEPSKELRRRYVAVERALDVGLARLRPGAVSSNIDARIRAELDRAGLECFHNTGHGIGTAAKEPPFLNPRDRIVLQEGMVLTLKAGGYSGGFGTCLETVVVVEADGARVLGDHPLRLR